MQRKGVQHPLRSAMPRMRHVCRPQGPKCACFSWGLLSVGLRRQFSRPPKHVASPTSPQEAYEAPPSAAMAYMGGHRARGRSSEVRKREGRVRMLLDRPTLVGHSTTSEYRETTTTTPTYYPRRQQLQE